MKLGASLVIAGLVGSATFATDAVQRTLTFDERVAAQKAIEQVYWEHRIWPKENPAPKPLLSAVMSDEAIQAKVEDYLKKSYALERLWQRPITAAQLQAEMDRMAKSSHDPQVLGELFAAVGNDPLLIAETLARQSLADRLIRNWYVNDARFHGEVKKRAEAALAMCPRADCMKSVGGNYSEGTWKLRGEKTDAIADRQHGAPIELDAAEWTNLQSRLAAALDATPQTLPIGRVSGLEETDEAFIAQAVLGRRDGEIVMANLSWPKRSFDAWWEDERGSVVSNLDQPRAVYSLPTARSSACTNDTWTATGVLDPDLRAGHTAVWTGSEMIFWGGCRRNGHNEFVNTGSRYNPSTDTWATVSTGEHVPASRHHHTAVWTGTEMIVWGGTTSSAMPFYTNSGGRYNPFTDSWTPTAAFERAPLARAYHTAVWTGTTMIIWGGYHCDEQHSQSCWGEFLNTGGRYDPPSDSWMATSIGSNVPVAPQYGHTAVWTGTEMIVWGGYGSSRCGRYDPAFDTWRTVSMAGDAPYDSLSNYTAVWTGTEMIIWGGKFIDTTYVNIGGRYNPSTDYWTATSRGQNVPAARYLHTAVWTGTEMIVWGGSVATIGRTNTGGAYNPSTDTWTPTSMGSNNPTGRIDHTAVWTGTEMIVWGGSYGSSTFDIANTGGRYNPSTQSWTPTAARPDAPEKRQSHAAVWTGAEMIIWGGHRAGDVSLNTGGRYNPSIDTWTATSIGANNPGKRSGHTAVWTGTEMIVWGGYEAGFPRLDTGGRYDPLTDSWTGRTSVGPGDPSARSLHTAVWTGTEMIVWGGHNGTSSWNTGGRYDPVTDSWAATSTYDNNPLARYLHTAVWTGTEMIVWGGYDGTSTSSMNTGGRYDPVADQWTTTSTSANAPSARNDHSAVWTGSEMIVWGGSNASLYLNTGGRYNPVSDQWAATPTGANVPAVRRAHRAVWTGTEMIVWGGSGPSSLNTGGRYNPVSNNWTATSMANVPSARSVHTAVWTGAEMIVWGGTPYSNTGGRYCGCSTYYRDADGDGFGNAADHVSTCDGGSSVGYVANDTDCNDANASVHPHALESNDGIDNQCPADPDYGLIDEISGTSGFTSPSDKTRFSWTAQGGATLYDVARSTAADFSSGCALFATSQTSIVDAMVPLEGERFYYLVRPSAPYLGSWGQNSVGTPRTGGCLSP